MFFQLKTGLADTTSSLYFGRGTVVLTSDPAHRAGAGGTATRSGDPWLEKRLKASVGGGERGRRGKGKPPSRKHPGVPGNMIS